MSRIRLAILFGGPSVEHEVSLVSARSLLAAVDTTRYEPLLVGVTEDGRWLTSHDARKFLTDGLARGIGERAALLAEPAIQGLVRVGANGPSDGAAGRKLPIDVVFPLIHGTCGEDGKLQGLLEMADLPYVGSGVLGSALGMDKEVSRRLFRAAGLPVVETLVIRRPACGKEGVKADQPPTAVRRGGEVLKIRPAAAPGREADAARETPERYEAGLAARISKEIGYPCFVKPANLGSSVGVSRAKSWGEALRAIEEAFAFDDKVLVERAVDAREIEVAVLGNEEPSASVVGEILTDHEFYDYEAKYHDDATRLVIPAKISVEVSDRVRRIAVEAFKILGLAGLARIDFLLERGSETVFLNEVNTLPGFTPVSMYPKLWEASGIGYPALVDRLIELAFERHRAKHRLRTSLRDTQRVSSDSHES